MGLRGTRYKDDLGAVTADSVFCGILTKHPKTAKAPATPAMIDKML